MCTLLGNLKGKPYAIIFKSVSIKFSNLYKYSFAYLQTTSIIDLSKRARLLNFLKRVLYVKNINASYELNATNISWVLKLTKFM